MNKKTPALLLLLLLFLFQSGYSDVFNVRSWASDGQIWVVWADSTPNSGYEIYSRPTSSGIFAPFFSVWDKEGSIFNQEGNAARLRQYQAPFNNQNSFTIPNGSGGTYSLASNEFVFAITPHESRSERYAIREMDISLGTFPNCVIDNHSNAIPAGSWTSNIQVYTFDPNPNVDPVRPHVQMSGTLPAVTFINEAGNSVTRTYTYKIWTVWIDGREDETDNRLDIPVMGNAQKNGTPYFFFTYQKQNADLTGKAMTTFLHGGKAAVDTKYPGNGPGVDFRAENILFVTHDDAFWYLGGQCKASRKTTHWFGYGKYFNPFIHVQDSINNNYFANPNNITVNYTQRRVMWTQHWLQNEFNLDPKRAAIMGMSMGGRGTSHIARTFPNAFSTATIFSTNPHLPYQGTPSSFGSNGLGMAHPTAVTNLVRNGNPVPVSHLWSYTIPLSNARDYPIMRHVHGQQDYNPTQLWNKDLEDSIRVANDQAWGLVFFWDQRAHELRRPNTYWSEAPYAYHDKTVQYDPSWQAGFKSDESYPAFYDVSMTLPTPVNKNNFQNLPHGTLGGQIGWEVTHDEVDQWEVETFLINGQTGFHYSDKDRSEWTKGSAHLTVRRNQNFRPLNTSICYSIKIQGLPYFVQGQTTVGSDGLITLNQLRIPFRWNKVTKVRFFYCPSSKQAENQLVSAPKELELFPNPSNGTAITVKLPEDQGTLSIFDTFGRKVQEISIENQSEKTLDVSNLPNGIYTITFHSDNLRIGKKLVVQK